jgi:hypothetical protein
VPGVIKVERVRQLSGGGEGEERDE